MAQSKARVGHSDDGHARPTGPRIQDVARRAGVAIGTVSNVLDKPDVVIWVPDELMVVGYNDNHFAAESSIPMSTVSLPGIGWVSWPSNCSWRKSIRALATFTEQSCWTLT
jgi:hypothetical protein